MSFAEGLSAGAALGDSIQRRLLAKELRKQEQARYADETAYNRGRDKVMDERWGKEFGASETDRAAGRDNAAQRLALSQAELAERKRAAAEQERRGRVELALSMGNQGMQRVAQGMQQADQRKLIAAKIAETEARTKAIQEGRYGASGGYDEYGPDGELVKRRVPVNPGAGMPTGAGQEPLTPESQEVANAIAALQTQIGQQKVQQAQGDNRTGFLNLFSRQGKIDDANAQIAKLRALQGGSAQPGNTTPSAQPSLQDQQALAWAKANPKDPRSAAILQKFSAGR